MPQDKITILFVIRKDRINQKNEAPLMCRITYKNARHVSSTGLYVDPTKWNSVKQQATGKEYVHLNTKLQIIRQKIDKAFLELTITSGDFSVDNIFQKYSPQKENKEIKIGLVKTFQKHNDKMSSLLGIDYSKSTLEKYQIVKKQLASFIKWKFNKNDISLNDLNLSFLHDFDFYLKTQLHQKQVTINKTIQRVRTIIKIARGEEIIQQDPFMLYKPKKTEISVIFLSTDELYVLELFDFESKRLSQVRDCYVFCCYTGLPYLEMASLKKENIIKGFDGNLWISIWRQKTNKELMIPLLPQAKAILDKYEALNMETLLPIISNQKFNSYLKEIAHVLGINKRLTHHTARKTFASTVLLYNNVPIEVVSELLGHSKITVTQEHYGRVVKKRVSEEMNNLRDKLSK